MQLTVTEAARLLKVDDKTVQQWIRKDGLPACKVNDQYRLNRVDLLEWATERGIKLSPDIFTSSGDEENPLPPLSQALAAGGIHYNLPGTDIQNVLKNVVDLLHIPSQLDPDFLLQVLLAREALGSTAIGDGIAIPHVRNPILLNVAAPAVTLCFLETPIDFKAIDNKPVNILFTLTSPTVKTHLHLLAKLAYALRDQRFKTILQKQGSSAEIMAMVKTIEAELGGD